MYIIHNIKPYFSKESPPRYPGLASSESVPRDLCNSNNINNNNNNTTNGRLDSAGLANLFVNDAIMNLSGRIAANYLNAQVSRARIMNQGRLQLN